MTEIKIIFNHASLASYRRLSYKWWYALAEFVDNSTQSYADNRGKLDDALAGDNDNFAVTITTDDDFIRIHDNAMGMGLEDLQNAMTVGKPPANIEGRSRYGLGMKTAACWIGNLWTVKTSKLGSDREYILKMDVEKIIQAGNLTLETTETAVQECTHYTIVEIKKHNRQLRGRTIGKVKEHLKSIYRQDLCQKEMLLRYNGEILEWNEYGDESFLRRADKTPYKKEFVFGIGSSSDPKKTKVVTGWVGVLARGSRSKAGFSILHRKRVIKGHPDSWRPEEIYGAGGRNDLINQRLVGEVHLEDFEVSHTKDEINWQGGESGDEENIVGEKLKESCKDYMGVAKDARGTSHGHGPTEVAVNAAVETIQNEIQTDEFLEKLTLELSLPPSSQIQATDETVIEATTMSDQPTFVAKSKDMKVNCYINNKTISPNDPYFVHEPKGENCLNVIINGRHPHWSMLEGDNSVVNYLRHCVYDAIAEFRAAKLDRVNKSTIRFFKDNYLRVAFEVLQKEVD